MSVLHPESWAPGVCLLPGWVGGHLAAPSPIPVLLLRAPRHTQTETHTEGRPDPAFRRKNSGGSKPTRTREIIGRLNSLAPVSPRLWTRDPTSRCAEQRERATSLPDVRRHPPAGSSRNFLFSVRTLDNGEALQGGLGAVPRQQAPRERDLGRSRVCPRPPLESLGYRHHGPACPPASVFFRIAETLFMGLSLNVAP